MGGGQVTVFFLLLKSYGTKMYCVGRDRELSAIKCVLTCTWPITCTVR